MGGKHESERLVGTGQSWRSSRPKTFDVLAILLLLGLLWFLADQVPHDPVYRGKALSLWLQTYDSSSPFGRGSREWNEADEAVRHIGTNAIPALLQMLRERDTDLKVRMAALAQKQRVINIHFVPAPVRNIEASRAFIVLGDVAKDAVPDLMKIYDENISLESQSAIEDVFSWIGPAAKPAIPLLLRAANNSNNQVRANALWALGEIHAEPQLCVPKLTQALGDSDAWARTSAAHALGKFVTYAQSAVPALMELTNIHKIVTGFSVQTQFEAAQALKKINSPVDSPANGSVSEFDLPDADPLLPPR
jgi:HEAT repeats